MRLHRLEVEAFGPFATRQNIDFDHLGASGLFLLEGPTGAGKTSILDALTFALYGGLAGRDAGADRLHSHFAEANTEPFVELEFSVRGVRHRIRRTPPWQRPKKRGTGCTGQAGSVHLERRENSRWRSLSAGNAEVGELVTDLLGLNRDQFTQVVLLPQGEFAQFLRASDDDRRILLTKIFSTSLFDDITAELTRRRAIAAQAVEAARASHRDRVSATAEAAGLPPTEREYLVGAAESAQRVRFVEVGESLGRHMIVALTDADGHDAELQTARAAMEQANNAIARANQLQIAVAELAVHDKSESAYVADLARLTAARRVSGIAVLISVADDHATNTAASRGRVRALDPDSPALCDDGCATELEASLRVSVSELIRAADALTPVVAVEQSLTAKHDRLTAAELHSDAMSKRLDQLEDRQAELPALVRVARASLDRARDAAAALTEVRGRERALAERVAAATSVGDHTLVAQALRERRVTAVDAQQQAVDRHQHMLDRRLDGMAAELAGQLRAHQACSVCGSRTHPHPAQPTLDSVTAGDVEQALAIRREAEANRQHLDREWNELTERLAVLRAAAGQQPLEGLTQQLAQARETLDEIAAVAATLPEAEATLTEREVEQSRLHQSLLRASADLAQAQSAVTAIAADLHAAQASVAAELAEFESVRERQATLRSLATRTAELTGAVGDLARHQQSHRKALERAKQAAAQAGFDNLDDVRAVVLDTAGQDEIAARVSAWQRQADRLRAAATAAEFDGVVLDRLNEYAQHAIAAAESFERERLAHQAARASAATAARMVERFGQRFTEFEKSAAAVHTTVGDAGDIVYLADLARGMDGQRRMNLTTYVLRRWFEEVVAAANVRLASMSSGRYALVRTDAGARANERSGLTLRVIDQHTGEQRSTASMSGGETFYTSLALALGLTDVVAAEAGGVEMHTLFIDEGFGSLDNETLDQVMAVIDELRDHGRVVGIVSHVADLKDRIQERVEVYRLRDGSSAVRVIA